jgi:hypothetical protein
MALITKTYVFTAGTTIIASEHNTNLDTIYTEINGQLDNANIKALAAIAGSKITPTFTANTSITGNLTLAAAGNKLLIKEGVNASMGTALMSGGTALVSNTLVTTSSRIFLTRATLGGTAGALWAYAVTSGATFRIGSSVTTESSNIAYLLVEPA